MLTFLQTVLFWELDQHGALEWSEGVEAELLSRLALRLLQHMRRRHLPHFFIPEVNLLDELTDTDFEHVQKLMELVRGRESRAGWWMVISSLVSLMRAY